MILSKFLVDNNYKFIIRFPNNCKKFSKITIYTMFSISYIHKIIIEVII